MNTTQIPALVYLEPRSKGRNDSEKITRIVKPTQIPAYAGMTVRNGSNE
ncbi:MAG: hypothetical protein ABF264_04790 [Flavobacteriales bacterium]